MALNLNASPYYDDFSDAKKFQRILFKPGVAVQARELTQLQTLLQDQVRKLGEFTLKEGSVISGCVEQLVTIPFIKINDTDFDGASVDNTTLDDYIGDNVIGGTTGLTAKVVAVKTGTEAGRPGMKTLYLKYIFGSGSTLYNNFTAGETLTVSSADTDRNGDTFVVNSIEGTTAGDVYYGETGKLKLSEGLIYARGQFILTDELETFIADHTVNGKFDVGFELTESVVTSGDDTTLLDPAAGSFNYTFC